MYEEFIIGYVLTGIAVVLLVAVIVLQCFILKKLSQNRRVNNVNIMNTVNRGMTICRKCATKYESVLGICPNCGTMK